MYFIENKLQQRDEIGRKLWLARCENSSQNLGCSKTSTTNPCLTEKEDYWQQDNGCDIASKRWKHFKHLFHRGWTPGESRICNKK